MADTQYRRLTWPRRRKGTFIAVTYVRSSLWLGPNHVLVVDSNGYSETYKRFYFQDIQAVTIRLTSRRLGWNWLLGPLTGFCLLGWTYGLLASRGVDLSGIIPGVIITLLFAIPLLINNLRGPTCACTLRTAVQTEELPSLCRLPKTRRILNLLRPLIAQAQGQLAPEEIPARLQAWTQAATATVRSEPTPAASDQSGVNPSSGAASSALPSALESSETSTPPDAAAPGDGHTPTAQPPSASPGAQVPYVVDDPNAPPKIIS